MSRPGRPDLENRSRQTLTVAAIVVVQALGAVFFVADAVGDILQDGPSLHIAIEGVVAFSLLAGVVFGAQALKVMLGEAKRRD